MFKPHSWLRGQSGLDYQTIRDGLILAIALQDGATATFNWEASRNKLTRTSLTHASFKVLSFLYSVVVVSPTWTPWLQPYAFMLPNLKNHKGVKREGERKRERERERKREDR